MKELDSDSSVHGIGREKDKSTDKKTPSDEKKKTSEQEIQLQELWNQTWCKGVFCIWQNM